LDEKRRFLSRLKVLGNCADEISAMAESLGQILNSEALTGVFGSWPSFHDAEVLRIRLNRSGPGTSPALEADIHLFEISPEVGPDGTYRQDKHTRATLLDVLRWEAELVSSHGVSARWLCESVSVLEAHPFDPSA
jgi:hypothetical protein